jgi:hypothetical protein
MELLTVASLDPNVRSSGRVHNVALQRFARPDIQMNSHQFVCAPV